MKVLQGILIIQRKKNGKLYEIGRTSSRYVFYEPTNCEELSKDCRLEPDPSRLGYWLMGTVLPSMPRDERDRKEKTVKILQAIPIGCTCSD
ncbi:MAG: hypothetical protein R2883_07210 [Caldisericia bacterium]